MKMLMTSTIEVQDSVNLQEIKQLVFDSFWKTFLIKFSSKMGIHGSIADIALKDKEVEICTDDDLRKRLKMSATFQATFKIHPLTGQKI
jgi:hypothetical protein